MEVWIAIIAICMVAFALCGLGGLLVLGFLAMRLHSTLGRVETILEDTKRTALPILTQAELVAKDVREIGKAARTQVDRSEYMVHETVKNLAETSSRLRDAVSGAATILSALGTAGSFLAGRGGRKVPPRS